MHQPFLFQFLEQDWWLTHQRCIYWQQQNCLILSDLHLGKSGHFRKHAIAIPQSVYQADLHRLFELISFFKVEQIIVVGDLFHSTSNLELDLFSKWWASFQHITMHLVKGNHDILPMHWYQQQNIQVHANSYQIQNIHFVHDAAHINSTIPAFTFTGHLHPGIQIKGIGKQSLRFPCYHFTQQYAVLPAFSLFTGLAGIKPKKQDQIFAIVENSIIPIHS